MAEDKKAKIAIIGAGWWAVQVYLPAVLDNENAQIAGVNRRSQKALDEISKAFPGVKGYTDYHQMLAEEKPDGVIIASPHTVHFEHAKAALNANCHVLIDKPMTTSADDARELVALAKEKNIEIVVPYGWNFKEFSTTAAQLIADGGVGEIRHVVTQMASPTADLFGGEGLIETKDHMFRPPVSTWADPDKAGGYGWGQLSHSLGLMFRLTGLAPAQVYALEGKSPAGVDYYNALTLKFANGATGVVSGSSTVPKQCGYQVDVRIFGTEGMLLIDMERARMELRRNDGKDVVLDLEANAGEYVAIEPVNRLVEICLGTAKTNEATGVVGMRAIEVLDAMYRSFRSGVPEDV